MTEVPGKRLRDALEGPKTPKVGWAKAKPKQVKPGRSKTPRGKTAGRPRQVSAGRPLMPTARQEFKLPPVS